jgi:two-component system sensor histidine kinase HydH
LVQSDFPSDEQRRQAIAIVDECDRVTARINEFLSFARPHVPELKRVILGELVEELKLLLEVDLQERELELEVADSVCKVVVLADRELLRQALFNILQNAIHASPRAGTIEVSVRAARDGRSRIEIADRGEPLSPAVVQKLFTPYFTTRADGTGLGLAIVRHVASLHGWEAGYSARAAGGAIFWLDGLHA